MFFSIHFLKFKYHETNYFNFNFSGIFLTGLFAQLKVANNGNVGIQLGTLVPLSGLSIGSTGESYNKVSVSGDCIGLQSITNSTVTTYSGIWNFGILGKALHNGHMHVGVRGEAYHTTPVSNGRSWGVLGLAGNATSGYNYGVIGLITGTNDGAGIVGVNSGSVDIKIHCCPIKLF